MGGSLGGPVQQGRTFYSADIYNARLTFNPTHPFLPSSSAPALEFDRQRFWPFLPLSNAPATLLATRGLG